MPNPELIAVFDTETTGVDVENDRIVTAFIGTMDRKGKLVDRWEWKIDPGIEIPTGASDVHGYTTERIRLEGRKDRKEAIFEIMQRLDILDKKAIPVVIYNAPFDLTILDREIRRHVGYKHFRPPNRVVDPFVIDKAIDPYRKGKRILVVTAKHYGVPVLENAHDAEADCIMAGQLARRLLDHPRLRTLTWNQIHEKHVASKRQQAMGFRKYLHDKADKIADPEERAKAHADAMTVSPNWPWTPFEEPTDG